MPWITSLALRRPVASQRALLDTVRVKPIVQRDVTTHEEERIAGMARVSGWPQPVIDLQRAQPSHQRLPAPIEVGQGPAQIHVQQAVRVILVGLVGHDSGVILPQDQLESGRPHGLHDREMARVLMGRPLCRPGTSLEILRRHRAEQSGDQCGIPGKLAGDFVGARHGETMQEVGSGGTLPIRPDFRGTILTQSLEFGVLVGRGVRQLERRLVAERAFENGAEMFRSGHRVKHPASFLPGRIVPQVLGMTAVQRRNPLLLVILVESDDATIHRLVDDEQGRTVRRARPMRFGIVRHLIAHPRRQAELAAIGQLGLQLA
jgi:hypothetical protein